MIIAIDFDGTCITHDYPLIGDDIGAVPVLKKLVKANHKLILWTMRDGAELRAAVSWFNAHDIPLLGVNSNPEQYVWTESPKAYAQLYIDDAALGTPLIYGIHSRPYVDWKSVDQLLKLRLVLE